MGIDVANIKDKRVAVLPLGGVDSSVMAHGLA